MVAVACEASQRSPSGATLALNPMATPTPKHGSRTGKQAAPGAKRAVPTRPTADVPEVVDPRWLLKAAGITVAAAVVCAYLAVCLLVYQGGWQYLLHPVKQVGSTPAAASIAFEAVGFDAAATGTPRLTGWWIPNAANAAGAAAEAPTILFLHGGSGSLADTVPTLAMLHGVPVNIFAFDYRGFGRSEAGHPTEARMTEDTAAALDYLVNTRHLAVQSIVPYGVGLGASLAASLVKAHADLPALIVDDPDLGAATRELEERRASLLPMRLLIRDRFDVAPTLAALKTPKLVIARDAATSSPQNGGAQEQFFSTLSDPKRFVRLTLSDATTAYLAAVSGFLHDYVFPAGPHTRPAAPQRPGQFVEP